MPTNVQLLKDLRIGDTSSALAGNAQAKAVQVQSWLRNVLFQKLAVDGAAATATTEAAIPWQRVPFEGSVRAVRVHPTAALTGDATNNATITINKRDAAGGTQTSVATLTTTVSWVAGTSRDFVLSTVAGALDLLPGSSLTFTITKGGTGVVVPISMFEIQVEET